MPPEKLVCEIGTLGAGPLIGGGMVLCSEAQGKLPQGPDQNFLSENLTPSESFFLKNRSLWWGNLLTSSQDLTGNSSVKWLSHLPFRNSLCWDLSSNLWGAVPWGPLLPPHPHPTPHPRACAQHTCWRGCEKRLSCWHVIWAACISQARSSSCWGQQLALHGFGEAGWGSGL